MSREKYMSLSRKRSIYDLEEKNQLNNLLNMISRSDEHSSDHYSKLSQNKKLNINLDNNDDNNINLDNNDNNNINLEEFSNSLNTSNNINDNDINLDNDINKIHDNINDNNINLDNDIYYNINKIHDDNNDIQNSDNSPSSESEESVTSEYNYYNDQDADFLSKDGDFDNDDDDDEKADNNDDNEVDNNDYTDNDSETVIILLPFSKLNGFCINKMFNYTIKINSSSASRLHNNDLILCNTTVDHNCSMTRAQFWEEFNKLKTKYKLSQYCCDEFISFMKKAFNTADLSNVIHLQYASKENSLYFYDKYFTKTTIDVCVNGCMVYAGDYSFVDICSTCLRKRYSNNCIPCQNQNTVGHCTHSNRTAIKTIEYRSILCLLKDLISSHPSFVDLISYYDYGLKNDPENMYFKDINNGESYKRNMSEMRNKFLKYKQECNDKTRKIIEISLCLSWFYDGCQLYHHLIYSFLPLIFTISNLPPPLRNKLGVGTFLLSIVTVAPGSFAEFFLLLNCFVEELIELFNGVSFIIDNTEYFIQCRLSCSILDLPALCKVFYFSSMFNSEEGCVLCNWGGGAYNKYIKKVKYANSRSHLPLRHYLRSIGFKICDCPPKKIVSTNGKGKTQVDLILQCQQQKFCDLWDDRVKKWILLFDETNTKKVSPYIWFNQDIADINEVGMTIKDEAVFTTHDYKLSEPYKRHGINYYDRKATIAIQRKEKATSKNQLKKISVNGIKGFSPLRALPYIRYDSDICQDPAHVLFVLALMILNIWSCDKENYRMFKAGVKEYYKSFEYENVFDCLYNDKVIIPWNFQNNEQMRVEAYFKCLLIPIGCKSKFHIVNGNIFKQKGIIKGSGKITVISVFMNLILFGNLHMSFGYRALFRIFSNVFCRIRNKKVFRKDVIPLFCRINELRSYWEGCIPITEMIQMLHALEDVSMHIPKQGPIAGFNALHGEQAIGFVKHLTHTKGSSRPELKAFSKAAEIEFNVAKAFYSKLDNNRSLVSESSKYLYWNSTSQLYVYNNERLLFEGVNERVHFNKIEFSCLLESFHRIIFNHHNCNMLEAIAKSSLFRILNLFKDSNVDVVITYLENLIHDYDSIIYDYSDDEKRKDRELKVLKIFELVPNDGKIGIVESDIDTIRQIIKFYKTNPSFIIYKKAIIPFQIKLRGRGFQYSENNKKDNEIKNCLNNLEECFYDKVQYSSWCKIRLNGTENNNKKNKNKNNKSNNKEFYGQANYFFEFPDINDDLIFPEYSILRNIKFVSATTYTFDFHKVENNTTDENTNPFKNIHPKDILSNSHLNSINIKNGICNNMKTSNPSFITLDEILPTEVLTFAFIVRGLFSNKAIYPYEDFNAPTLEEYAEHKENFMISLKDETWLWKSNWYLAFIDGSPENLVKEENATILEEVQYANDFYIPTSENNYEYW